MCHISKYDDNLSILLRLSLYLMSGSSMGIPADVLVDITGDSTHPSPADSLHLILAHDIGRRRFLSQDGDATSSVVGEHAQLSTTLSPLERGSATAGGAKARRMLLAAERLLRCRQML
jgi:hypothetical protein